MKDIKKHLPYREVLVIFYGYCDCRSFSRYTRRTEMSAGETPLMRAACPMERGRMTASFSAASRRRLVMALNLSVLP